METLLAITIVLLIISWVTGAFLAIKCDGLFMKRASRHNFSEICIALISWIPIALAMINSQHQDSDGEWKV
jgi:hypothetical protein